MKLSNLKITLLRNTPFILTKDDNPKHFYLPDATFDLNTAMKFCGQVGGICYNENGLLASFGESDEITERRINRTTHDEHQSIFEHINIGMHLEDSSKMLNMVLNNEGQYATSERSLRYTTISPESCNLSEKEIELYQKWYGIFYDLILAEYPNLVRTKKNGEKSYTEIETKAQENARYMCSVFINTSMVYTVPLAQLNRIVSWMKDYMNQTNMDDFAKRLSQDFEMFIKECERLNLLDERLQSNRKHRKLHIFGECLDELPQQFGESNSITYLGTPVLFAQYERHRRGRYCLERKPHSGCFIPPLIVSHPDLVEMFKDDFESIRDKFPMAELYTIHETGCVDDYVLKMEERDCSHVQLETFKNTVETAEKIYQTLEKENHPKAKLLKPFIGHRRCQTGNYECPNPCGWKEGIDGTRKV